MYVDLEREITELKEKQITLSDALKEKEAFKAWWNDFRLRFCWSSNSIEGNTLTLEETIDVIEYDEVRSGHTYSEYQEAKMLYQAILDKLSLCASDTDETWLKSVNAIITNTSPEYRTKPDYIGSVIEAIYYPPDYRDVPDLMGKYMDGKPIKEDDLLTLFNRISEDHIKFERIHPFLDGNGRTGRILLNQELINNNLLPVTITNNSKYRQSFKRYDKTKDLSLLTSLLIKCEEEAIERFNSFVTKLSTSQEKSR